MDEQSDKHVTEPERQITDEEILRAAKGRYDRMIQALEAWQITLPWRIVFTPLLVLNLLTIYAYLHFILPMLFLPQAVPGIELLLVIYLPYVALFFSVVGIATFLALSVFLQQKNPQKGRRKVIFVLIILTILLYALPVWIFIATLLNDIRTYTSILNLRRGVLGIF